MINPTSFEVNQLLNSHTNKMKFKNIAKLQYNPPSIKLLYSNEVIKGGPTTEILESNAGQYGS